jgi:hypothetical protein
MSYTAHRKIGFHLAAALADPAMALRFNTETFYVPQPLQIQQ